MTCESLSLVKMTPSICMAPSDALTYAEALDWVRNSIAPFVDRKVTLEWESPRGSRLRWVVEDGRISEQKAAMLWSAPTSVETSEDPS